jgi:Leucine-rich repeat (LRR) protein
MEVPRGGGPWEEYDDGHGNVYFYNAATGESIWKDQAENGGVLLGGAAATERKPPTPHARAQTAPPMSTQFQFEKAPAPNPVTTRRAPVQPPPEEIPEAAAPGSGQRDSRFEEERPDSGSDSNLDPPMPIHIAINQKVVQHTEASLSLMRYDQNKAAVFGGSHLEAEQQDAINDPRLQYSHLYQEEHSHERARHKIKRTYETRKEVRATTAESNVRRVHRSRYHDELVRMSSATGTSTINSPVRRTIATPYTESIRQLQDVSNNSNEIHEMIRKAFKTKIFTLSDRELTEVPPSLFNTLILGVGYISGVMLSRNRIPEIPSKMCRCMRWLSQIDLSNNELAKIPNNIHLMWNLKEMKLDHNHLSTLPDNFMKLRGLQRLTLQFNWFGKLPDRFGDLTGLVDLKLQSNNLECLPPTFPNLLVSNLDLSNNQLVTLAILPMPEKVEEWIMVKEPRTGQIMWNNPSTGETRREKPPNSRTTQQSVPAINLAPLDVSSQAPQSTAEGGLYREWELVIDSNNVKYKNNKTGKLSTVMPGILDRFGKMVNLTRLNLNSNLLQSLPSSLTRLVNLEFFDASRNYIKEFPSNFVELSKLKMLILSHNELHQLPSDINKLSSLERLFIHNNQIQRIPVSFGKLPALQFASFGYNMIEIVPDALKDLTTITDLQLHNNPLRVPSMDVVEKGVEHILWDCRQRALLRDKGYPPIINYGYRTGIGGECLQPPVKFEQVELKTLLEKAKTTKRLYLDFKSLTRIPPGVFDITDSLESLRIIGSDLCPSAEVENEATGEWVEVKQPLVLTKQYYEMDYELKRKVLREVALSSLIVLNLRSNGIRELTGTVGSLQSLRELYLDDNLLEELPKEITNLEKLQTLHLTKNHLRTLPDTIHRLYSLSEIFLGVNQLINVPDSFPLLQKICHLNLSSNNLTFLPAEINLLNGLITLNVCKNKLILLPESLADLACLRDLRASHNG